MPPGARHRLMGALLTAPENKLLSKQLASISATLASASQRRDTAAKEIASRRMSHSSTPLPPAQLSFSESSTVLEHTTPGHAVPPTTDGCQAVTAVDGAAVELEENGELVEPFIMSNTHSISSAELSWYSKHWQQGHCQ